MIVRTSRIDYRGDDRLDVTVKGQHPVGRALAPNWPLVRAAKEAESAGKGEEFWPEYVERWRASVLPFGGKPRP